ncbi:EAL domain-containing protein [Sulfurospirillum deleyianum]|uniref:EAL domain protein n=1 Tax=Sulfurospirillum deleyianum (strain ATCC 51133 / DSM 6946 / 5175) TaxID=525898 RepID=D1AZN7_SULD5|nr:EAL domain-containing protein [Sulfurospirillum deleyianum]ACZ11504.1 EAL domain protein [Sulfurospirillum deleyianum DSM 6946]
MPCVKCQSMPFISTKSGDVILSCEVPELCQKLVVFFKAKSIRYSLEDAFTMIVMVDGFKTFLESLTQTNIFNKLEKSGIRCLFLEPSQSLTPTVLRQMRTLQYYHDVMGANALALLIEKGALTTHFQPIIDLKNDTIYGYESLARGVNDDGSLVYPDTLFRWAKEGDMLFYLDRACRETSLKTAAVKNIHAKVFINFIPTAIYDPEHCLQSTVKWANQLEFDPKNIIFEVTESEYVEDLEHLSKILQFYKAQGFNVALDDVGSGYSSLTMIAKLQPDIVKIDRQIIDRIDTNPANQAVFKAIVSLAKESHICVLAEGVERVEEVAYCAANGADLAQGYYFGRPSAEPVRKL